MLKERRKHLTEWMHHILIVQIVLSTLSSLISLLVISVPNTTTVLLPILLIQGLALTLVVIIDRMIKDQERQLNALYVFMVFYVILQTFVFIDFKGFFVALLSMTWYISYLTLYSEYKKMILFIVVTMYLFFAFAYKNYNATFQFSNVHLIALLNYFIISIYIGLDLKRFNDNIAKEALELQNKLNADLLNATQELAILSNENKRLEHLDKTLIDQYKEMESKNNELIREKTRVQLILEASNEVLWDLDIITGIRHFSDHKIDSNPNAYTISDNPVDWYDSVHPDDRDQMIEGHQKLIGGIISYFSMEFRDFLTGEYQWYLCRSLSQKDEFNRVIRIAGSYSWIHPQKQKDLEIESFAFYDLLTGFPNRAKLIKDLFEYIQSHNQSTFTIYFVDLNGFREINNTYGHNVGDEIICSVAKRLSSEFDLLNLYRINGPEFIFVDYAHQFNHEEIKLTINSIFESPFTYTENSVHISYNIGISIYPKHGLHPEVLIKHADTALYHAKLKGNRKTCIYDEQMTDDVTSKTVISNLLYNATKTNEFLVYFQPIYNLETESLYGFEALLRWFSPQLGQISPTRFIPIAEETGIIIEMGPLILSMALKQMMPFLKKNSSLILSVNVSAKQLAQDHFINTLNDIVDSVHFPKTNLCLEITESILIESFELIIDKLNYLRNLGYLVALDDFGTGYSSLNYLSQLPITTLKIDKAFVDRIYKDSHEFYLLKSMITLASDLSLSLIVEGIETQNQRDLLKQLGCILFQGFYFSRPIDPVRLIDLDLDSILINLN